MRDPMSSPEYLRVERDMHVSGLRYEFLQQLSDLPSESALDLSAEWRGLWLVLGEVSTVGIGFLDTGDEEERTYWVADQIQDAVLDSGQVVKPAPTWPKAERGGSPLWAQVRGGVALWESADGTERYRIGELPAGR